MDEIKELVRKTRDVEKARRTTLTAEERKILPSLAEFLTITLVSQLPEGGVKIATIRWISKLTTGKEPKIDSDSTLICFKYRAYPVNGVVPEWVGKKFELMTWYWNVLTVLVQHELRLIGDQYASISEAEKAGVLTEKEAEKKRKTVSYEGLHAVGTALNNLSLLASAIREGGKLDAIIEKTGANVFNLNLASDVARLTNNDQKQVEQRFVQTMTNRTPKKGQGFRQGYPHPAKDSQEKGQFKKLFRGDNIDFPLPDHDVKTPRGVKISIPVNPEDHHGSRGGKYRSKRDMRVITITEGGQEFVLNVLFHAYPAKAKMKGYSLTREFDGTKAEWYFIPMFEIPSKILKPNERIFCGFDPGWRKAGEDANEAGHTWDSVHGDRAYTLPWGTNRYARRYSKHNPDFPIEATPNGLTNFQSRLGQLQRDMKAKMTVAMGDKLPAGWEKFGKRGMVKLMDEARQTNAGPLVALLSEFNAWKKEDAERGVVFTRVSAMVTDNKRRLFFQMAKDICSGITDLGLEATDIKGLAEKEAPEDAENWKLHIKNVQQKNRQRVSPAEFMAVLAFVAEKSSVRVHWVDPHYTTRRCSSCHCINEHIGPGQFFTCSSCNIKWNRDENAARNMAQLAEMCAEEDIHPTKCLKDGKKMPHHGIKKPIENSFSETKTRSNAASSVV